MKQIESRIRKIRLLRPAGLVLYVLFVTVFFLSCGDDPVEPGGGSSHSKLAWAEIDSFVNGGRIAALCGHETGDIYCAYLGVER